jgi:hypothetical protein
MTLVFLQSLALYYNQHIIEQLTSDLKVKISKFYNTNILSLPPVSSKMLPLKSLTWSVTLSPDCTTQRCHFHKT